LNKYRKQILKIEINLIKKDKILKRLTGSTKKQLKDQPLKNGD
jgi:hypothetical protein